jgi:RNA recognition motif-containing protein
VQITKSAMKTKLHVGNLSSRATEKNLCFLFAQKGRVSDVQLTIERTTGRSRAFAIVTMATVEGAEAALLGLHRSIWNGRHITVHEMPPAELNRPLLSFGSQQQLFRSAQSERPETTRICSE